MRKGLQPEGIAHDPVSGSTFWTEPDFPARKSQLLRHDLDGNVSVALNNTFDIGVRDGSTGSDVYQFPIFLLV